MFFSGSRSSAFDPRKTVQEIHVARMPGYSPAAGADNTVAFQAAVNEALTGDSSLPGGTNPGRVVVLPPGTTVIQPSTFTLSAYKGFSLRGSDNYPSGAASVLAKKAGTGTSPLITINCAGSYWTTAGRIENVKFIDPTTQGGDGLYIDHTSYWRIVNCTFWGFAKGLNLNQSFSNLIDCCHFEANATGIYNGAGCHNNTFRNTVVIWNTTQGFYLAGGFAVYIDKCDLEQNGNYGIVLDGATSVKIRDVYSEGHATYIVWQKQTGASYRVKIDGLWTIGTNLSGDGNFRFGASTVAVFDFCEHLLGAPTITNDGGASITKTNCTF